MTSSDYAVKLAAELESASRLRTTQFLVTQRPWLDLYGVNVRPVTPFRSLSSNKVVDTALLHRSLPDELLFEIFSRMSPYTLGRASCVCRKWRYTIRNPVFWRNACLKAWQLNGIVENYKIFQSMYHGSWRKMWLLRPRVRTDGLYVSRNTYIRAGVAEWKITNPVHIVCYFRYMRFYTSGRFLYKNSSQKVKDVAKYMNIRSSRSDCVFSGQYTLSEDKGAEDMVSRLAEFTSELSSFVTGRVGRYNEVVRVQRGLENEKIGLANRLALAETRLAAERAATDAAKDAAEGAMKEAAMWRAEAEAAKQQHAEALSRQGPVLRAFANRLFRSEKFSEIAGQVASVMNTRAIADVIDNISNDIPELDKAKYGYLQMSDEAVYRKYAEVLLKGIKGIPLLHSLASASTLLTPKEVTNCPVDRDDELEEVIVGLSRPAETEADNAGHGEEAEEEEATSGGEGETAPVADGAPDGDNTGVVS